MITESRSHWVPWPGASHSSPVPAITDRVKLRMIGSDCRDRTPHCGTHGAFRPRPAQPGVPAIRVRRMIGMMGSGPGSGPYLMPPGVQGCGIGRRSLGGRAGDGEWHRHSGSEAGGPLGCATRVRDNVPGVRCDGS
eukprot:760124-Hanusia_phi.AAC.7